MENLLKYFIIQNGTFKINQVFDKHMMKLPLYHSNLTLAPHTLTLRPQVGDQPYLAWSILKIKTTIKKLKKKKFGIKG
jgi:hypothetical protein